MRLSDAFRIQYFRKAALVAAALGQMALPSQLFAKELTQSTALFPVSRAHLPRIVRPSPLAEQASAAFAVLPAVKGGAALQPVRHRLSQDPEQSLSIVQPVCGQAPDANTFACYNLGTGETLADVPIPGQLTTTPQYYDGSWYIGTSRGFFIKYDASGVYMTPGFGIDSQLFHGPDARLVMKLLSAAAFPEAAVDNSSLSLKSRFRGAWNWFATANAEFIGTPQFGGSRVFALTANQSLNAYDIQSGKMLWGVRLAPEVPLRLMSTSLVVHERGVLVGTGDGHVLLLDPKNGQSLWRINISGTTADRFAAVTAPVLPLADGIVASNAESATQRLNWETRSVEWSYGVGSVVQPKYDDGSVFVAGSDGAIHRLDARTGQLRWRRPLPSTSPLVAMTLLKKYDVLLVAASNGAIFALRLQNGDVQSFSGPTSFGPVIGDFFAGRSETNEVCLSYRTPGYACWTWRADSGNSTYVN